MPERSANPDHQIYHPNYEHQDAYFNQDHHHAQHPDESYLEDLDHSNADLDNTYYDPEDFDDTYYDSEHDGTYSEDWEDTPSSESLQEEWLE